MPWDVFKERYASGEARSAIFCDIVLEEIRNRRVRGPVRVLDIGCGTSFDGQWLLQYTIAQNSDYLVGVEPDRGIAVQPIFHQTFRSSLEDAPVEPASIDVAFSMMVLEHVADPARHWHTLRGLLKNGGVFLGFTMDARHWFAKASKFAAAVRVKDRFYPPHYRSNTPNAVSRWAGSFETVEAESFGGVGRLDHHFPGLLRPVAHGLDRMFGAIGGPGPVLAVKAVKGRRKQGVLLPAEIERRRNDASATVSIAH